ncbi:cilia- and flagella-associated protein 43 isoform X2 [Lingula anatina]|uniref:Cilia- and flagella-associated protein 43 n=1 Tax=Lingula anatina TaxID=7574 RepID=A0A1S3HML2_LINAN|nr:cilia- and flagella-associated protein 43 isoform X2 [Lingula anatina]|eukprot:XP_013386289.1 cilia- and flagella-associated protein 43 isoform X2 [Lingula anatina]
MESIGSLVLSWAKGYDGNNTHFIDKSTICFACGHNVTFVKENGEEMVFPSPGEGVGTLAVHSVNKVFAFSDLSLPPKVFVYSFPGLEQKAVLQGGAQLEYSAIAFSASDYLATVSGLPEFELAVWDYIKGNKLCTVSLPHITPTGVSINPAKWRQICVTTDNALTLYHVEQSDEHYLMKPSKTNLPVEDSMATIEEEGRMPTRASTRLTKMTVELPKAAVAGLVGEMAERWDDLQDHRPRVVPKSHCWTPVGDLYVGCEGGQLLKVDGETHVAKVMYTPGPKAAAPPSREPSQSSLKLTKKVSMADMDLNSAMMNIVPEGAFRTMALHKTGLFAGGLDGTLRKLEVKGDNVKVVETTPVGLPISSMSFSSTFNKLALGSSRGALHVYDLENPGSTKEIFDIHHGNFVAVDSLAGCDHCVSVREDGELQVWRVDTSQMEGFIPIGQMATSLACSPLLHMAVVGTELGYLFFIDLNDTKNPRPVYQYRIHTGPVNHIVFDKNGRFIFTASDDGNVFVIDSRASKNFEVVGHTAVAGDVQSISMFSSEGSRDIKVVVTSNNTGHKRLGATIAVVFDITDKLTRDFKLAHASLKKNFRDDAINKMVLTLTVPSYGAAITNGGVMYTISQTNKMIHKMILPEERPPRDEAVLSHVGEYPGHQLPGGRLIMSPHNKWVASYGPDGKIYIRTVGDMDHPLQLSPHDYRHGGVRHMTFSGDSQMLYTVGYDGIMACYKWRLTQSGQAKAKSAIESARAIRTNNMQTQQTEDAMLQSMKEWSPSSESRPVTTAPKEETEQLEKEQSTEEVYTTPTPVPGHDSTWLQAQELMSIKEEDKEYAEVKKQLRLEIKDMRKTIQKMMQENEGLPDTEKLGRHEFDLDIDEQIHLQQEADNEVARIREEIEFEDLAKRYVTHIIKTECWDEMVVKGRSIEAFISSYEVSNFPMKKRSKRELDELDKVTARRAVEIAEVQSRRELTEVSQKTAGTEDELNETDDVEAQSKDDSATTGSLSAKYGGGSKMLYSQFELHTREQKQAQIILLQDVIHRIKLAFNKEFDETYQKKEQEVAKIRDRNKRIRKILDDLDMVETVTDFSMSILEKPERLLVVEDSEVKVEKYYTPQQRKKLEEEARIEEERRAREKGDNARERALDMMMGGVLEIKKEDELKKDVPIPAFIQTKPEDDWTEEEQKIAKEYEKKVKELQEEREKFRKQLEMELKKLQTLNQDTEENFDEALKQLFVRRVKTDMVIYQEELKILRLQYSLLIEEELETRDKELCRLLEHKKMLKTLSAQTVAEARKHVDEFREKYDILVAEDKVIDKVFKREFNDVPAVQLDQLYKLFRRRPRGGRVNLKDRETPIYDPKSGNPFADRPSTARQNAMNKVSMESALQELDKESNMPEGVQLYVWERLCRYRRQKIDSEQLVKQKALVLAEMENGFLRRRLDEDEQLKRDIEEITIAIEKLKEDVIQFNTNLEAQLVLKQGQVEVDPGNFIHDFRDSILIHRSVVEELNGKIKQLGEGKIASMVDSKDFRKGIIQLEWEHKKNIMQIEDLQRKMRDINMMKVTRQIQSFLNEEDHEAKRAQEAAVLEQTIMMQKKHHEKNVEEHKKIVKDLKKAIQQREEENKSLERDLEELNVSVNERSHINDVNADKTGDGGRDRRYQEIVQRRKLVDLAKAQAQEVAVLRAEVERLRMRTFPALVQVEH